MPVDQELHKETVWSLSELARPVVITQVLQRGRMTLSRQGSELRVCGHAP